MRFHAARHGVVLRADDARIENARRAGQRIDRRINAALDDLPAEVGRRVQVRKRRGRSRVGVVVGRHVNRLHRSDRTALRRSDALLQFADFGVEVRLIAHGRRHAAEKRGNFRARLHETENVVDEEQHVEMLLVAEIFRDGQAGEADAQTRPGRLGHLAVNQSRARLFRIARHDDAAFGHFQPQVVAFARAFADAREHGNAAVLHRDVVNQLHDENGLAHARAAEKTNLAALQIRLDQVDDLDSRLKHFERRGLIFERRRRPVNRIVRIADDGPELIDGFPKNVHHAAKRCTAHGNFDPFSEIVRLHAAHHALDGLHRDGADAAFAEVLLHFRRHVERLGNDCSLRW